MSDNEFAKKGFVDDEGRKQYISNIKDEINNIQSDLKKARLTEIPR